MNEDYTFRPATSLDGETVRRLVFAILREYGLAPDPDATDADLANIETSYVSPGGSFDLLVDSAGVVVGTVGLFALGAGRCELRKMYLAQGHRGRGLGKRLVERAIARARELGFHRIELETASVLKRAGQLYEAYGFRPCVPQHLSPRCDRAYYLELEHDPAEVRPSAEPPGSRA
jgi:putative acetyltransferase